MAADLVALLVAAGFAAGLAAGLFGVGGGILMVPALHYLAGATWADAVAASLLVMVVTTPLGMGMQHAKRLVRWREGAWLGSAGVVGVLLARLAEPFLPLLLLKVAFAALMAWTAWRLARGRARPAPVAGSEADGGRAAPRRAALLAAGLGAGFIAKLLGIGGGLLMVPALVALAVPIHAAVATSLFAVFLNALAATGLNLLGPRAWIAGALWLLAGGLPGIALGVLAAQRTRPRPLQTAFAGLLGAVALYVLGDALGLA